MKDSQVMLGGGRELAYTEIGRPGWPCVFFFHGAPMSRLHLVGMEEQVAAQGLRVVSPDRPGYGRSSPQPGRSLGGWPADVAALADALGVDRFLVAGHSSGGPYAVVCAALLSESDRGGGWIALTGDTAVRYLLAVYVFSLEHLGLTVEIDELFVVPPHRGNKVGRALLMAAESEFVRAGCTNVSLQLSRGNDSARAFYHRHGYTERSGFELLEKALDEG
jgi:pimeloyl-ACP methyl ester carboxylesterase